MRACGEEHNNEERRAIALVWLFPSLWEYIRPVLNSLLAFCLPLTACFTSRVFKYAWNFAARFVYPPTLSDILTRDR
jgi:hypothetical protein